MIFSPAEMYCFTISILPIRNQTNRLSANPPLYAMHFILITHSYRQLKLNEGQAMFTADQMIMLPFTTTNVRFLSLWWVRAVSLGSQLVVSRYSNTGMTRCDKIPTKNSNLNPPAPSFTMVSLLSIKYGTMMCSS